MHHELLKKQVAIAALAYVQAGQIIGIGSGSTVYYFIEALAATQLKIRGAVSSSEVTTAHLKNKGIEVLSLDEVSDLPIYIDSADAINAHFHLIKGGGGALTREKVLAYASAQFVCMVDSSKWLADFCGHSCPPLPVEVLPMARSYVESMLRKLDGHAVYRRNFFTDNGNIILDVRGLNLQNPPEIEKILNQIPGIVESGLFTQHCPDYTLLASLEGISVLSV